LFLAWLPSSPPAGPPLRFSDVFNILANNLGRDLLKEAIRIKQIREIFGIRAVDEIKKELNIS